MEASEEFSCSPPRMSLCSAVSVFQRTSMSHFLGTHLGILNHECRIWGMSKWNVHVSVQFEILSRAVHQPVVWMQRRSASLLVDDKMNG